MAHYEWREKLSGFEIQMKDDEEKKNREMEELNQRVDWLEEKMELLLNKDYSE